MDEQGNEIWQETSTEEEPMEHALPPERAETRETPDGTEQDGGETEREEPDDGGASLTQDRREALLHGLKALAEDGWTSEELAAFSRDEGAARDIAGGKSLETAALRYMRRMAAGRTTGNRAAGNRATAGRAGVPTMRAASAGEPDAGNPIARMSDREFDAFYARAMEKAMTGARVTI